ncbi:MAG: c-type cytochrome [Burkholderiales bacterium]
MRMGVAWAAAAAVAMAGLLGAASVASADDAKRAEEIVQGKCFLCHGADGESSSPVFPRLAGQNAAYVARQLADYKSGRRKNTTMQPMVEDLTAADFTALGAWYASRPTHAHEVSDPGLAKAGQGVYLNGNPASGVPACASCHGPAAQGSDALPRLAGQHAQYVENQLRQFGKRERTNDNAVMHAIASKLTEQETKAVAAYLSGLK